jgi:urease accessory protein UreF
MENNMTNIDHFAGWTTTQLYGKTVWVESFEAAVHFQRKEAATKDMMALRALELVAVKTDAGRVTRDMLDYLGRQMVEANKKIIAANRKARSKGWYVIEDERMQQYKKDRAQ